MTKSKRILREMISSEIRLYQNWNEKFFIILTLKIRQSKMKQTKIAQKNEKIIKEIAKNNSNETQSRNYQASSLKNNNLRSILNLKKEAFKNTLKTWELNEILEDLRKTTLKLLKSENLYRNYSFK